MLVWCSLTACLVRRKMVGNKEHGGEGKKEGKKQWTEEREEEI